MDFPIPPTISTPECVNIWFELRKDNSRCAFSDTEKSLYDALTKRLAFEVNILGGKIKK